MNNENFDNPEDARNLLYLLTTNLYCFAEASQRTWGTKENFEKAKNEPFVQLMPETDDDGFFDWYIENRPYNQFFKTKEMCVIYFIRYWSEWKNNGKPLAKASGK